MAVLFLIFVHHQDHCDIQNPTLNLYLSVRFQVQNFTYNLGCVIVFLRQSKVIRDGLWLLQIRRI